MGLSNIEKNTFKCLQYFHFYLRPFPVQWNENFTKLYISQPYFKYFGPFAFLLLFTTLYALSSLCVAFYIKFQYNAERIEVLVQLLIFGGLSIVSFVLTVLTRNVNVFLVALNRLIQMASEIEKAYRRSRKVKMDFGSILLHCLSPVIASGIIIVPVAYVATGLDTFHYVAVEFLGDPKFRSNSAIVTAVLIRYLIALVACLEVFRSIAYFYVLYIMLLKRWKTVLVIPVTFCRNASELCKLHIRYRLVIKATQSVLEHLLCIITNAVFWGLVLSTWICVKSSPSKIGYIMYAWFFIITCLLSQGLAFFFTLFCKLMDLDKLAVQFNIVLATRSIMQKRTWQNKIVFRQTVAVRPIRLKYGLFGYIGCEFFSEFVWTLIARIFDAIIIFDY